jgi:hypothetical protein
MVHSLALARAERKLTEADDFDALEAAWSEHCDFPDESDEQAHLLRIYQERAEAMALEAGKVLMAG